MAVGIIAEFNPFHNGHKYLIEQAKANADDKVVVIMSGSFVQRGGIAITDKLTRAKLALLNGADLVIELPLVFSHNTAQKFAYGAIATLQATGVIDSLAFGSETGDRQALMSASHLIADEPYEVSEKIKRLLDMGKPYPVAREEAYEGYFDTALLKTPNNILALEYLSECIKLNFNVNPIAVKRTGANHDSSVTTDTVASATEIRKRVLSGEDFSRFMPSTDFDVYDPRHLDTAVIAHLRIATPEMIEKINDVSEGLQNKFISASMEADTVDELCMAVKSKRYTYSRIRRIAYSCFIGLTKEHAALPPSYIRVLGMNSRGMELLRKMKNTATLPVITKPADYNGDEIFNLNSKGDDIFALCSSNKEKRKGGNDLRMTPVIL